MSFSPKKYKKQQRKNQDKNPPLNEIADIILNCVSSKWIQFKDRQQQLHFLPFGFFYFWEMGGKMMGN